MHGFGVESGKRALALAASFGIVVGAWSDPMRAAEAARQSAAQAAAARESASKHQDGAGSGGRKPHEDGERTRSRGAPMSAAVISDHSSTKSHTGGKLIADALASSNASARLTCCIRDADAVVGSGAARLTQHRPAYRPQAPPSA